MHDWIERCVEDLHRRLKGRIPAGSLAELCAEVRSHLYVANEELLADGHSPECAQAQVMAEFGAIDKLAGGVIKSGLGEPPAWITYGKWFLMCWPLLVWLISETGRIGSLLSYIAVLAVSPILFAALAFVGKKSQPVKLVQFSPLLLLLTLGTVVAGITFTLSHRISPPVEVVERGGVKIAIIDPEPMMKLPKAYTDYLAVFSHSESWATGRGLTKFYGPPSEFNLRDWAAGYPALDMRGHQKVQVLADGKPMRLNWVDAPFGAATSFDKAKSAWAAQYKLMKEPRGAIEMPFSRLQAGMDDWTAKHWYKEEVIGALEMTGIVTLLAVLADILMANLGAGILRRRPTSNRGAAA